AESKGGSQPRRSAARSVSWSPQFTIFYRCNTERFYRVFSRSSSGFRTSVSVRQFRPLVVCGTNIARSKESSAPAEQRGTLLEANPQIHDVNAGGRSLAPRRTRENLLDYLQRILGVFRAIRILNPSRIMEGLPTILELSVNSSPLGSTYPQPLA